MATTAGVGDSRFALVEGAPPAKPTGFSRRCVVWTAVGTALALGIAAAIATAVIVTRNSNDGNEVAGSANSQYIVDEPGSTYGPRSTLESGSTSNFASASESGATSEHGSTSEPASSSEPSSSSDPGSAATSTIRASENSQVTTASSASLACDGLSADGRCPTVTAANCAIAINAVCYTDLASAVTAAKDTDTITINQDISVGSPIKVERTFTIEGTGPVKVISNLNAEHDGIFNVLASRETTVTLRGLTFDHQGPSGSLLRTPHLGDKPFPDAATYAKTHVTIDTCTVQNFQTGARGGGAIFLGAAGDVNITNSRFSNNRCIVPPEYLLDDTFRWESGGGAVWIAVLHGALTISSSTFDSNIHEFTHSAGGGILIYTQLGPLNIDGASVFSNNTSSGGGAISVLDSSAPAVFDGVYSNNIATCSNGWNSRGGAMWLQFIYSTVEVRGTFTNNVGRADPGGTSRAGTIANNIIYEGAKVTLSGKFSGNTVTTSQVSGMVWDSASPSGSMKANSVFILAAEAMLAEDNGSSASAPLCRFQNSNGVVSISKATRKPGVQITVTGSS